MANIKVKTADQALIMTDSPLIASGGVNEDTIIFDFDSSWTGYTKTAVFYVNAENVYHTLVSSTNTATVPQEVLKAPGTMLFGVMGVKGNEVKTSEVIRYQVAAGAITESTEVPDPTPDIYAQILAKIDDVYFLTKMQELNKHGILQFWIGTRAEYEQLTPLEYVLYIITDEEYTDYVVQHDEHYGGSNDWRYRRWQSGRVEADYYPVLPGSVFAAHGSGFYTATFRMTIDTLPEWYSTINNPFCDVCGIKLNAYTGRETPVFVGQSQINPGKGFVLEVPVLALEDMGDSAGNAKVHIHITGTYKEPTV